ncbi:MAG TPA: hypothetical protein PKW24_05980 [Clostridiales bacterium]|jgi:hypothetical protein|nr:hypothetical protein [Clostridiales bacterium]HRT82461.1 hypothetical protein [Oscillospiraceae bacterium]
MKFKSIIAFILALSLILLAGCNKASSPEKAVEAYCNALVKADFKTIENLTAKDGKEGSSPYEGMPEEMVSYFKDNLKQTEFTLGTPKTEADTAVITVRFKYPSAEKIFRAVVQEFLKGKTQGSLKLDESLDSDRRIEKYLVDLFNEKKAEMSPKETEISINFNCVKEKNGWKISGYDEELYDIILSGLKTVEAEIIALFDLAPVVK